MSGEGRFRLCPEALQQSLQSCSEQLLLCCSKSYQVKLDNLAALVPQILQDPEASLGYLQVQNLKVPLIITC